MNNIIQNYIIFLLNKYLLRFAQALEVIPRVLAENSGVKPKEVISKLYAAHSEGKKNVGFDIEGESGDVKVCCY